ncbi:MAG: hypothetical protein ACI4OT_00090 [Bacilli bacterium]
MYEQVNNKINEIIALFQENDNIKEMIRLKDELLNDDDIKSKLTEYEKLLVNPYDKKCLEIKKYLLNDKRFAKYKNYEDDLYILVLKINKELSGLLKEKSCFK